jgi:hypothetical protein
MKTIAGLALAALIILSWRCFVGSNISAPRDDHALATLTQFGTTASGLFPAHRCPRGKTLFEVPSSTISRPNKHALVVTGYF